MMFLFPFRIYLTSIFESFSSGFSTNILSLSGSGVDDIGLIVYRSTVVSDFVPQQPQAVLFPQTN